MEGILPVPATASQRSARSPCNGYCAVPRAVCRRLVHWPETALWESAPRGSEVVVEEVTWEGVGRWPDVLEGRIWGVSGRSPTRRLPAHVGWRLARVCGRRPVQ